MNDKLAITKYALSGSVGLLAALVALWKYWAYITIDEVPQGVDQPANSMHPHPLFTECRMIPALHTPAVWISSDTADESGSVVHSRLTLRERPSPRQPPSVASSVR
jgi:hypothetical protein